MRAGQEAPQHGRIHPLDTGDLHLHPLNIQVTNPLAQDLITPAQYWHDPLNHTLFLSGSHYLADINNEQEEKNSGYRQDCIIHIYISTYLSTYYLPIYTKCRDQLLGLETLVLVRWADDTTIIPSASSQFGFYPPGQVCSCS